MADVKDGFNYDLDLITEKETVYDFVSRLSIGKDWTDPEDDKTTIFKADTNLKNILRQIAKSFPTSIYENLECLKTTYVDISSGASEVTCNLPGTLLLAVSERTGFDLTDYFTVSSGKATMITDVAYESTDRIRFYCIGDPIT